MAEGKVFGELAILYNCTRTATVKGDAGCCTLENKLLAHIFDTRVNDPRVS